MNKSEVQKRVKYKGKPIKKSQFKWQEEEKYNQIKKIIGEE